MLSKKWMGLLICQSFSPSLETPLVLTKHGVVVYLIHLSSCLAASVLGKSQASLSSLGRTEAFKWVTLNEVGWPALKRAPQRMLIGGNSCSGPATLTHVHALRSLVAWGTVAERPLLQHQLSEEGLPDVPEGRSKGDRRSFSRSQGLYLPDGGTLAKRI